MPKPCPQHIPAKQQSSVLEYDALGRLLKKTEADLISNWTYDSAANGTGKLARASTSTGYVRTHQYDSLGRPTTTTVILGNDGSYSKTVGYDAGGRQASVSYPTGLVVNYQYNPYGYLQRLSNAATGKTYWQADSLDAAGRATRQLFAGGSAAVNRVYNNRDRVELVDAGAAFQERYLYDSVGNLKTRNLKITAGTPYQYNENFSYDELNRLTKASGDNPVSTQDIVYDELGNITYKSGVGSYSYPASGPGVVRPHALTALKGVDGIERGFDYDANGNLVRNENRLASWTSYNLPKTLAGYGQREEYWYDAEHERIKQVSSQYGTQLYFNPGKGSGLFYEKTIGSDGKVEHKHYLTALGDVIGEVVKRDNPAAGQAAEEERYWVKDHLGSNRAILSSSGQLLESLGFDAWGKRRYASGQTDAANPGIAGQTTDRGYTGHEHLDELGLINMNARIYDPLLGRFLSPDPQISAPDDMQDFNRYSYAWNNPLSYADTSGENENFSMTGGEPARQDSDGNRQIDYSGGWSAEPDSDSGYTSDGKLWSSGRTGSYAFDRFSNEVLEDNSGNCSLFNKLNNQLAGGFGAGSTVSWSDFVKLDSVRYVTAAEATMLVKNFPGWSQYNLQARRIICCINLPKTSAVTTGAVHIIMSDEYYEPNYSAAGVRENVVGNFAHEMFHTIQAEVYGLGAFLSNTTANNAAASVAGDRNMVYDYALGGSFSDYTMEQQGQMVQDFVEGNLGVSKNTSPSANNVPGFGGTGGYADKPIHW